MKYRQNTEVEFTKTKDEDGRDMAVDITEPDSTIFQPFHQNINLPNHQRLKRLSDLQSFEERRFRGIICNTNGDEGFGYIMPDLPYYREVLFLKSELQTTGHELISPKSEVEFSVRKFGRGKLDRALCITRPNGKLMTWELGEKGKRRRQLGDVYTSNDTFAHDVPVFENDDDDDDDDDDDEDEENDDEMDTKNVKNRRAIQNAQKKRNNRNNSNLQRQRGLVTYYDSENLYGFISSIDTDATLNDHRIFVHVDDCHIAGKRVLRKGQLVEYFVEIKDHENKNEEKKYFKDKWYIARHVTGIDQSVLHSVTPNHYTANRLLTNEFEIDDDDKHKGRKRYWGTVRKIYKWKRRFVIQAYDFGYPPVIASLDEMRTFGPTTIQVGTSVEFNVKERDMTEHISIDKDKDNDDDEHEDGNKSRCKYEAINVTAQGGIPFVTHPGLYGIYMEQRLGLLAKEPTKLPPTTKSGETVNGFISFYNPETKTGEIEVCWNEYDLFIF